jgi:hypothetical protein
VLGGGALAFSANGMFKFSSAGASPDKGGALALVSIRSFGFFFTCGIEVVDRELSVAAHQEGSTSLVSTLAINRGKRN